MAIPSKDDKGLESTIEEHFGRSRYFTLVDIEKGKISRVTVVETPFQEHKYGDLPRFLKDQGVNVILACKMGPRAQALFEKLEIKVILGFKGTVEEAVKKYLSSCQ